MLKISIDRTFYLLTEGHMVCCLITILAHDSETLYQHGLVIFTVPVFRAVIPHMIFAEPHFGLCANVIDDFGSYCYDVSRFDFRLEITTKQELPST